MTILELEKKIKCDKETFEIFFREHERNFFGYVPK